MISVEDRGSTRSGRTYLPGYIDRIPEPRRLEIFERLANLRTVDVNNISNLMTELTISRRPENEPEKPLREYGAPSARAIRKPILFPEVNVEEYEINTELIYMLQENAFQGEEDENPLDHIKEVHGICETFGPKGLSREFVLLKLFRWSLKGKAFAWLQSLPHHCITS
jgi:hypothetical protein